MDKSSKLQQYAVCHGLNESSIAKSLREMTDEQDCAISMSSPEQVQLMTLLVKLINAKKIIEIGVLTGYTTLRLAEALPESGEILACDITDKWMKVGEAYWKDAEVDHKIKPMIAPATKTLQTLIDEGRKEEFDLVYIDADKTNYGTYYALAKQLVRVGGLIIVDNTLWDGQVLDPDDDTEDTVAIRALNNRIHKDKSVDQVLLPIGDGVTIVLKR